MPTKPLSEMALEELARHFSNVDDGSMNYRLYRAEFWRRQTKAQVKAARYMMLSAFGILLSALVTAVFSWLSWAYPIIPGSSGNP